MKVVIFDIETDGLLDELTKVHVITTKVAGEPAKGWTDNPRADRAGTIAEGIQYLNEADVLVGHNIIGFDLQALLKLGVSIRPDILIRDTMVLGALLWPRDELRENDFKLFDKGTLPGNHIGSNGLEAWGFRLGILKGTYSDGWAAWSDKMHDYALQDAEVTFVLWEKCLARIAEWGLDVFDKDPVPGLDAVQLEHDVARIIAGQERRGFGFDTTGAFQLHGKLSAEFSQLTDKLALAFPPRTHTTTRIMQATNSKLGYVKGQPFTKTVVVPFDPGSRKQAAIRLMELGWSPSEYTKDGSPKLDDDTLRELEYPEAQLLADYYTVQKIRGYLAEGREAWIRHERNGRIHGRVHTNGAITGRMTHSSPNLANVPSSKAKYGKECRALFGVAPGHWLVGTDADGLELRCLAHYMARYDQGAYVKTILEGNKALGTDMHSVNARALGFDPTAIIVGNLTGRDIAKTFLYAFMYGAGDWKLGFTMTQRRSPQRAIANVGAQAKQRFLRDLPALGSLIDAIKKKIKRDGWVRGLDGRRVQIRHQHAALNTLLQGAGAIIMKRALVLYDIEARSKHDGQFWFVANIHDEVQVEATTKEVAESLKVIGAHSITKAGEFYSFRCPLIGNSDIGKTWADSH